MSCRLFALYNHPGVHPVGIEETLQRDLVKLFLRAVGDQVKVACGNL